MNGNPAIHVQRARYGSEVFKRGLDLYKRQSLPLFLLAFGEIAFGFLVPLVMPFVLKLVVFFVTPVVSIGVLRCVRFLEEHEGPATVSETFRYFYDDSRRADYLPLCVLSLVAATIAHFSGSPFAFFGLLMLLVQAVVAIALFYGVPLVEFNRMPALDALKLSLEATTRNWRSLTVYGLLVVLYSLLCVISLGIGFLFLMPIATAAHFYFWQETFDPDAARASIHAQATAAPAGAPGTDGAGERDVTPQP